jgi:hypothetical protein
MGKTQSVSQNTSMSPDSSARTQGCGVADVGNMQADGSSFGLAKKRKMCEPAVTKD